MTDAPEPGVPAVRLSDSLTNVFWVGVVCWVVFAAWSVSQVQVVTQEREAIAERVGWLVAARQVEEATRAGADDAVVRAQALEAAVREGSTALVDEAEAMLRGVREDDVAPVGALVTAIRVENAGLSANLAARWDLLSILLGVGLALGGAVLVFTAMLERGRRRELAYRASLDAALAELAALRQDGAHARRHGT